VTYAEYARINAINWSTLREIGRSPLHYRYLLEHGRADTATLALGRAVHTAVLEPERFGLEYVVFGGPRRAGKEWEAFKTANEGVTILKADEYAEAVAMRDAVHRHKGAMSYLVGGAAEQTVTWTERINGMDLACKARPDYLGRAIADLKTSKDAGASAFGRTAARFGYHCQLAWYRRGVRAALGRELDMVLVAVESAAPYDVAVYRVTEDQMYAADDAINDLLLQVAACRRSDRWPGAQEEEGPLELPSWALDGDGDEELTSEVIEGDLAMPDYSVLYPSRFMKKEALESPKVIRITKVTATVLEGEKGAENKVVVAYKALDGEGEIVWCKTNAELTAHALGTRDYEKWVGRLLTIYNNPNVDLGGKKVGGIRVWGSPELTKAIKVEIKRPRRKKGEVYHLVPTDNKGKPVVPGGAVDDGMPQYDDNDAPPESFEPVGEVA
jgi:hypothetical protein